MILPTKHVTTGQSLLGVGATVLDALQTPTTLTSLWERVRTSANVGSYRRLILALDLLYLIGAIEFTQGLIRRTSR